MWTNWPFLSEIDQFSTARPLNLLLFEIIIQDKRNYVCIKQYLFKLETHTNDEFCIFQTCKIWKIFVFVQIKPFIEGSQTCG